jgi:hypothetical protein
LFLEPVPRSGHFLARLALKTGRQNDAVVHRDGGDSLVDEGAHSGHHDRGVDVHQADAPVVAEHAPDRVVTIEDDSDDHLGLLEGDAEIAPMQGQRSHCGGRVFRIEDDQQAELDVLAGAFRIAAL